MGRRNIFFWLEGKESLVVSDRLGETDALVAIIVDGVVSTENGVTENPFDFHLGREVHFNETGEAGGRSEGVGDLDNVVRGSESERSASNGEGDIGKRGNEVAINDRLSHGRRDVVAELIQILQDFRPRGVVLEEELDPSDDILASRASSSGWACSNGAANLVRGHAVGDVIQNLRTELLNDLHARECHDSNGANLLIECLNDLGWSRNQ